MVEVNTTAPPLNLTQSAQDAATGAMEALLFLSENGPTVLRVSALTSSRLCHITRSPVRPSHRDGSRARRCGALHIAAQCCRDWHGVRLRNALPAYGDLRLPSQCEEG